MQVSVDVLTRLVYSIELRPCIECVVLEIVSSLVESIGTVSSLDFFEFLMKIIRTFSE